MTTSRSDVDEGRSCLRGCLQQGVHFAKCTSYGATAADSKTCRGCAPEPVRKGLLVCGRCFVRMRWLLRHAPELLARLRSLSDQGKAVSYAPGKVSTPVTRPPDAVAAELLDAIMEIAGNLPRWTHMFGQLGPGTKIDWALTDEARVAWLSSTVLDMHGEDADGGRHWSLADAAASWGIERRDRHVHPDAAFADDAELLTMPVREWYDPTLELKDAATRVGVSVRALQRWVKEGALKPAMRHRDANGYVRRWFYTSELETAAAQMRRRRHVGRAGVDSCDTPTVKE